MCLDIGSGLVLLLLHLGHMLTGEETTNLGLDLCSSTILRGVRLQTVSSNGMTPIITTLNREKEKKPTSGLCYGYGQPFFPTTVS